MRKQWLIWASGVMLLMMSCNGNTADERMADAGNTEQDTVSAPASAAIAEDSTLQPVEEVTLKVTGNTMDEMAFDRDSIKVPSGTLVKIEYINEGTELPMIHNLVIADSGTYKAVALLGEKAGSSGNFIPANANLLAASPMALPGQTVIVEFQAPLEPGTFDFVCTYPDHWQKKHGTLVVK